MRILAMRFRSLLPIALLAATTLCNAQGLAAGKLIEHLKSASGYDYALYLPSQYSHAQRWPAIMTFDPGARGALAAEIFRPAADKFGYIIIASNDSKNGPVRPQLEAADAMRRDLIARYNVDERRIYTAGFSGGARTAVTIALLCKTCIAGVIGCGAGFPEETKPNDDLAFDYYSLIGIYDFNFAEVAALRDEYSKHHPLHHFAVFDGTHDWPPPEAISDAVAWLDLRAMARGLRHHDETRISVAWQQAINNAQQLESSGKQYQAFLAFDNMLSTFAGLLNIAPVEQALQSLRDSRPVRDGRKQERRINEEVARLQAPVANAISAIQGATPDYTVLNTARAHVADLRKRRETEKDPARLIPLRRALGAILVGAYESAQRSIEAKQYGRAGWLLDIASGAAKDQAEVLVEAAANFSLDGDTRQSISELKAAQKLGFQDWAKVSADDRFKSPNQQRRISEAHQRTMTRSETIAAIKRA